jgi:alpha-glutamyl/putrescinyl thymine pyrophosphorylase clade 1
MKIKQLLDFILEREAIRCRRAAGEPQPWTNNPILSTWSFTNVRREDDRVTRWVATNWREPHRDCPDMWFAMIIAVFINWPDTLAELGYPVPWNREHFLAVMAARAARGAKLYGPAYMIHADNKNKGRCTAEYQAADVFNPLWRDREWLRPVRGETLTRYCARLSERHGFGGGFMTGQVIAYLKYVQPLREASDWMTFAVSGPGSRAGLNRVFGRRVDEYWSETAWRSAFNQLREAISPDLTRIGLGDLHAQDLQNCLCEFDKYERVHLVEGKPRRRFHPSPDPLPGTPKLFNAAE